MATIGYTTAGSNWSTASSNLHAGLLITPGETILVSKLTAYIRNNQEGHATCEGKAIIYRESDKALIATGSATAITDNLAASWLDFVFASAVELAAVTHRISAHFNANSAGCNVAYNEAAGYTLWNVADTYSDGPMDPLVSPTDYTDYATSIYATYTTASGISIPLLNHLLLGD